MTQVLLLGASGVTATQLQNADSTFQQPGVYGSYGNLPPSTATSTALNRLYVARFTVPRTLTILSGCFGVSTPAGADDSCQIGIYDASCATVLASSAVTAGKLNGAAGRKILALTAPIVLSPGVVYYSAFISGLAGTAASISGVSTNAGAYGNLFGAAEAATFVAPTAETGVVANAGSVALPSSPSVVANAGAVVVAWRSIV